MTTSETDRLIEQINAGELDPHIEGLLAALHGRKRLRRGVRNSHGLRVPR